MPDTKKPSREERAKIMGSYQKHVEKKFREDWVSRDIKNEHKEKLLSRMLDLVKTDRDDDEEKKTRKALLEKLEQRRLAVKSPKLRAINPGSTIHPDGFFSITITPNFDDVWSDNGNADYNGSIYINGNVQNDSLYLAAGIGTWFQPPVAGVWSFQPTITYNFDWYVFNNWFGGASINVFFAITIYTFLDGQYLPEYDQEVRYPMWYGGVGAGIVNAELQPYGQGYSEDPVLSGLNLSPEFGYNFWVWFGISEGAGPGALSGGFIDATVSAMTFSCNN